MNSLILTPCSGTPQRPPYGQKVLFLGRDGILKVLSGNTGLITVLEEHDGPDPLAQTALQPGEAATPDQGAKADTALQDATAFATAAQGQAADLALPKSGGTMTGDLTIGVGSNILFTNTTWDDIRIVPSAFDFAGNKDPTNVTVTIAGVAWRLFEFVSLDECFITVQMPHGYKRGSVLRPHVHWTPGASGNEEAGKTVGWKCQIASANLNNAFGSLATVDLTSTVPVGAVDGMHLIGPSADYTPVTNFGESGMLLVRLYRDGGTWAGTATGSLPLLLEFDIHYQIDKIGSDDELPT